MTKLAHYLAVLLLPVLAFGSSLRIPAGVLPYKSTDTKAWIATNVLSSQNPLVYVSVLTGLHSGATEIYEVANGAATYAGHLTHGGGVLAVDSQQNLYVVQANYTPDFTMPNTHVYVYARGSKQYSRDFTAQGIGATAMAIAVDGTIYLAGQLYANPATWGVMKFSPGSSSGVWLPSDPLQPAFATGIAADGAGNVFVGWQHSLMDPCQTGCVELLAPGQSTNAGGGQTPEPWSNRIPNLAANSIEAGPFLKADGSFVFWTGRPGRFNYIETVPSRSKNPSKVAVLPPDLFPSDPITMALNGDGSEIWGMAFGFAGLPGSTIYQIDYPSGKVSLSFQLNPPQTFFFSIGLAVSPAYYPPN